MNNSLKNEDPNKGALEIEKNYEDEHWSKKYGVSSEELKKTGHHTSIPSKIIEATFKKKKSYSF